jgi:RHS repeat-associated protein
VFGDSVLNAARNPMSARRRRLLPRGVGGVGVLLLASVLAITGQASAVPASSAAPTSPSVVSAATGGTGTGGSFVSAGTRIVDTRNGTGGFSTAQPTTWRSYPVTGVGAIPSTGVASVVVTVTALTPSATGYLNVAPSTSLPSSPRSFLQFDAPTTASNTGVVDVGTDGKIALQSTVSMNVLVDVQGYFTVGNGSPAPGGYVSAHATRIVDTRSGQGSPCTCQLGTSSTTTFQATGSTTEIPASATAVYANITVLTTTTTDNYVTPFPTDTTRPGLSLNFRGADTAGTATATAMGATIDLNSAGQFNLWVGAGGGPVDVLIDIQGYFDGEPSLSGFTPLTSTIYDSRSHTPLAAASTITVPLAGVGGVPAASTSLAGVALNVVVLNGTGYYGYLRLWPGDEAEPTTTSMISYEPTSHTSNLMVLRPSLVDGTIKIHNPYSFAVDVILDAEGYFTNSSMLPPAVGAHPSYSGVRGGQSPVTRTLTDRSGLQINPTNGNLTYTQSLFSMAGVGVSSSVGVRYNALNDNRPTLNVGLFEGQLSRDGTGGNVTYTAPDGGGYVFTPTGTSYAGKSSAGAAATLYSYVEPAGVNAHLVRVGSGVGPGTEYDLTFHPSQKMNVYSDNGSNITMNSTQDMTGANKISYAYSKGALRTVADSQGRTITFGYSDPANITQPSTITDTSLGRAVALTYAGGSGALSKIVDATGAQTLFTYYANGKMATVTDGRGGVTAFNYDGTFRLATMVTASGSSATTPATWSMAYSTPTTGSTRWTDPNGHTVFYAFNGIPQVTTITDGNGHNQTAAFNSHNDPTTRANAYNDTTTMGYATGTNNLTSITAPSTTVAGTTTPGRSETFQYPAPGSAGYSTTDFRPTTVTDAQANVTSLTYNNFGETITSSTDVLQGGTQHRTYQGDNQGTAGCGGQTGQLCTSTDGKGNITSYSYTAGNVTTITPPAPLGVQTFVYDAAGRKVSEHDGRGNTAYTCYDLDDRITQVSYATAACATVSGVTYTYDAAGNMTRRVDAAGTTTISYDAMNRPLAKTDGTTVTSLAYDRADNITSYTDPVGITSYQYDNANNVVALAEPGGSCPVLPATPVFPNSTKCVGFSYDYAERRTGTNLPNGVLNTLAYDTSSRPSSITAQNGPTVLAERDYLRQTGAGADTSLIQSTTDPLNGGGLGTISNYRYDPLDRLTRTAVGPKTTGTFVASTTTDWTYDLNGNRTQQAVTGVGAATTNYGYNAADQLCWTATTTGTGCTAPTGGTAYSYDGNGNQTSGSNSYSNYDQLTATTTVGAQTYAGTTNNERSAAGNATFTNSILGQVSTTVLPYSTQEYIRDPSGTLIAMQVYPSGSNTPAEYYYTADIIGSTIAITNAAGANAATYTYDSWGNTTATTGGTLATTTNPWRYGYGYTDANGTIKLGARFYDSNTGRFTQPDPSGQEDNSYLFVGANPIANSDPSGLCTDDDGEEYSCASDCDSYNASCDAYIDEQPGNISNPDIDINYKATDVECAGIGLASIFVWGLAPAGIACGIYGLSRATYEYFN